MPAYDYRCVSCGAVFEVTRGFHDRFDVACPQCGATARRVFRPVGVVFKGSGFHNTDYKPRPSQSEAASAASPACSEGASTGGCDACPAATPPSNP